MGKIDVLAILTLPICEHGICSFISSAFISLNDILQFSVSCTYFVKFIPRYLILFDGIVSGTVFKFQLPIVLANI